MRVVFLDVDGTLTNGLSAWEKVHHTFGVEKEMEKHSALFYSGKISYDEWARIDVGLWKGKPYSELVQALANINLIDGAKDGVQLLKQAGFDVILISGGIDIMTENVAKAVGADLAISNSIGHQNGIIDGTVKINVSFSKADVVEKISHQRGYDLDKSGAIGDNTNDIEMFYKVGYSVALNSENTNVEEAATASIKTNNFKEAAKKLLSEIDY